MKNKYSLDFKRRCLELYESMTAEEIYNVMKNDGYNVGNMATFKILMSQWNKNFGNADMEYLRKGTFKTMTPQRATVQIGRDGSVTQCWIKQEDEEEIDYEKLFDMANQFVSPLEDVQHAAMYAEDRMLEVPLFDMHFGISELFDYREQMNTICQKIERGCYTKVVLIIGQDLFHNNDMRGRTAKGTQIQKVDIERAWQYALKFYSTIITCAAKNANEVELCYSEGNHDETLAWAFFQCIKVMYQNYANVSIDDFRAPRKCISWNKVFIGYGHCDDGRTSPKDVRMQFTIEFPVEFASSDVREIHLGHLHTEMVMGDVNGVMVRRLSTANKTDDWHSKNGYVGNHKRFMLFEYMPSKLAAIYYV